MSAGIVGPGRVSKGVVLELAAGFFRLLRINARPPRVKRDSKGMKPTVHSIAFVFVALSFLETRIWPRHECPHLRAKRLCRVHTPTRRVPEQRRPTLKRRISRLYQQRTRRDNRRIRLIWGVNPPILSRCVQAGANRTQRSSSVSPSRTAYLVNSAMLCKSSLRMILRL